MCQPPPPDQLDILPTLLGGLAGGTGGPKLKYGAPGEVSNPKLCTPASLRYPTLLTPHTRPSPPLYLQGMGVKGTPSLGPTRRAGTIHAPGGKGGREVVVSGAMSRTTECSGGGSMATVVWGRGPGAGWVTRLLMERFRYSRAFSWADILCRLWSASYPGTPAAHACGGMC